MKYTIYHNARCRKSRDGLELLKDSGKDFEIREYLKEPLTKDELRQILNKLNYTPLQLVRTSEKIWKENYKGKDLSEEELMQAMVEHPKLIERPIVENDQNAVVGRPATEINKLL
ncbi:arsenate reductase (glutaredoxin) [Christiangramia portivictoriae]|uniref:arsenate reductase (glutaredoxin) n=1 Tax=Christiangramia portivictoriae TaxID=326069 RepID=UPI000410013D|nr:arsenate reductase (glutaredoxin) [Christiangramia portivictoriae]